MRRTVQKYKKQEKGEEKGYYIMNITCSISYLFILDAFTVAANNAFRYINRNLRLFLKHLGSTVPGAAVHEALLHGVTEPECIACGTYILHGEVPNVAL